jgi:hypothetical protein
MKNYSYLLLIGLVVLYSCKSESPVVPENSQNNYTKLYTVENLNAKFELYSATANRLLSGYNDLGFKVFVNNQEKTDGFVKFFPKMYHPGLSYMHSSPTSPAFSYNQDKQMFTGYASFFMTSDSVSIWYGFYNYNDVSRIDSVIFYVDASSTSQVRYFFDINTGNSYYLTLVSPFHPVQGQNVLKCILHKSNDDINFTQIENAEMFIRPWMETMGHGSSNNVNPTYKGGGIYEGTANFNMSGIWFVYDSMKVGNNFITPSPPPKFTFDVP